MCDAGELDLEQVQRVKDEIEAELLQLPGVTGVGVGYRVIRNRTTKQLVIKVYVKHKSDVLPGAIPEEIRGVPTEVIERRFVLHPGKANRAEGAPSSKAVEKGD